MTMRTFLTTLTRSLVPGVLALCVIAPATPAAAQERRHTDSTSGRWATDAVRSSRHQPGGTVNTPIQKQIDLKLYGFYIGAMEVPVAQVDVPIRLTRFLTVTPSYMCYSVPASGLNKLPPQPANFTDSYDEHQFRIDGTVAFAVRKFEISGRNMYVQAVSSDSRRRHEPLSRSHLDRASPPDSRPHLETVCLIRSLSMSAGAGGTGIESGPVSRCHSTSACSLQPSYMWETSDGNQRRSLRVVRPDRQHAIGRSVSLTTVKRRLLCRKC